MYTKKILIMQKVCLIVVSLLSHKALLLGVQGFVGTGSSLQPGTFRPGTSRIAASSFDIDSDGEAEQYYVGEKNVDPVREIGVGYANGVSGYGRYHDLVVDLGLEGKLKQIGSLPSKRIVSPFDVFCNRELKQSKLAAVGFDMDYTLCQYKQPAFDKLAFDGAKEKLVYKLGYPKEVLEFEYDHERWTRGLIIDKERGNFLKIDRHKYVRVAYHGLEEISSTTRKYLYARNFNKVESFSEKNYVNMDTLFQFVDAHLFALLINMKDSGDHEFLDFKTYGEIYQHIRESVDLCHRDGVIKDEVARNPEKYILLDKGTIPMLKRYREAGIKVFLLTNSFWEYTSTAMNYLYHGKKVEQERQKLNEWTELFDLCIAGSCKPAFMLDPYLALYRVNMDDGSLKNTDGVYEIDALGPNGVDEFLNRGKVFQGGNWQHLHKMLGVQSGDSILYVGDHLYADVLRSKRTLGWRSVFIMPELEDEIRTFSETLPLRKRIARLRGMRDELALQAEQIRREKDPENHDVQQTLREMEEDDELIASSLSKMLQQWHAAFHPIWGAMFNAGYQDSRFAFYVENYACLYTSRASNLGLNSELKSFRTTMEMLPHDKIVAQSDALLDARDPWEDSA